MPMKDGILDDYNMGVLLAIYIRDQLAPQAK
jgi:hypothetical protein